MVTKHSESRPVGCKSGKRRLEVTPLRWAGFVLDHLQDRRYVGSRRPAHLEQVARTIDACIFLCWTKEELQRDKRPFAWAKALMAKFVKVYFCRGVVSAMTRLKEYFALCRLKSLEQRTGFGHAFLYAPPTSSRGKEYERKKLMQISRASRSLPEPISSVLKEEASRCKNLLTTSFSTERSDMISFGGFCKHMARPIQADTRAVSSSASFGFGRAAGGQAEDVRLLTNEFRSRVATAESVAQVLESLGRFRYPTEEPDLFRGFPPATAETYRLLDSGRVLRMDEVLFLGNQDLGFDQWEVFREELFLLAACYEMFILCPSPPVRQAVVPERGWKVRTVSAEAGYFGVLSNIIGSCLLEVVRQHPRLSRSEGSLEWGGVEGDLIRSLDLKTASDHLPLDLCLAGFRGMCAGLRAPLWFQRIGEAAIGRRTMRFWDGSVGTTHRGLLMGNPVTWPLLSFYVAWVTESVVGCERFHHVWGDDLIVTLTRSENVALSARFARTGAVFSEGKDFATDEGYGVFTERLILPFRKHVVDTVSIRALSGCRKGGSTTPSWMDGPQLSKALKERMDLCWYVAKVRRVDFLTLRDAGIDPCAPRWVGGAGFPGIPSQRSFRLARMMYSQNYLTALQWAAAFEAAWMPRASRRLDFVWGLVLPLIQEFGRITALPGEGERIGDIVVSIVAQFASAFTLVFGALELKYPALRSIAGSIARLGREIALRGYWAPHERVRDRGLFQKLRDLEPLIHHFPFFRLMTPFVFENREGSR